MTTEQRAQSARDKAVELVDAVHGYTIEFSPNQNRHAYFYDKVEAALKAEREECAQIAEEFPCRENEVLLDDIAAAIRGRE